MSPRMSVALMAGAAVISPCQRLSAQHHPHTMGVSEARRAQARIPKGCIALRELEWAGATAGSGDPSWMSGDWAERLRREAHAATPPTGIPLIDVQLSTSGMYSEHTDIAATAARAPGGTWNVSRVTKHTGGPPPPPPAPPPPPPEPGSPPPPPAPELPDYDLVHNVYEGPLAPDEARRIEQALADPCLRFEPAAVQRVPDSPWIAVAIRTSRGMRYMDRSSTHGQLASDSIVDVLAAAVGARRAIEWGEYSPPAASPAGCASPPSIGPLGVGREAAEVLRNEADKAMLRSSAAQALVAFKKPRLIYVRWSRGGGLEVDAKGSDGVWRSTGMGGWIEFGGRGRAIDAALADPCLPAAPVSVPDAGPAETAAWRSTTVFLMADGHWRAWTRSDQGEGPLKGLF